ncbi:MAG: tetratricopeptide repeat protein [Leptolyngbyaceae cyanobacterium MO_188.B28]|nr:tetratricopeptide repeat protein [Leptolyngbyaceae cyanobacterium MO_188.B28]
MINQQLLRWGLPLFLSFFAMPVMAARGVLENQHPALSPNRLAQRTSIETERLLIFTGELNAESLRLDDGRYYNRHRFEGLAGELIAIELTSDEFDAYLILQGPAGTTVAENNDGDGTNARLVVTLPTSGAYVILANTSTAEGTGAYQLVVRAATERDQQLARIDALNQQVRALYQLGRYGEAIERAEEALMLQRQLHGDVHPDVAESMNNLAVLYQDQGRYDEAEPLYEDALALRRQLHGDAHPAVANSMNNLAMLYRAQGRYDEAEPLYEEALALRRQLHGDAHLDVATSMNNLAGLYQAQGRYDEAEPLYEDALAIAERLLGENHPNTVIIRRNLENLRNQRTE